VGNKAHLDKATYRVESKLVGGGGVEEKIRKRNRLEKEGGGGKAVREKRSAEDEGQSESSSASRTGRRKGGKRGRLGAGKRQIVRALLEGDEYRPRPGGRDNDRLGFGTGKREGKSSRPKPLP